jgi:hypothetical protein
MDTLARGERSPVRIRDMRLPSGDEAIYSFLRPKEENGIQGTVVQVDTRRAALKRGDPKHAWSVAVLEEANCLMGLLNVEDPSASSKSNKPVSQAGAKQEILLPSGTPVELSIRRFLYSDELKINLLVILETASEVKVGDRIVVPRGALAMGRVIAASDREHIGAFNLAKGVTGHAAWAKLEIDFVLAASGEHISVRDAEAFRRDKTVFGGLGWASIFNTHGEGGYAGRNFGLRAGTSIQTVTD